MPVIFADRRAKLSSSVLLLFSITTGCNQPEGEKQASSGAGASYEEVASCYVKGNIVSALEMSAARSGKLHVSDLMSKAEALGQAKNMTGGDVIADLRERFNEDVDQFSDHDPAEPSSEFEVLKSEAFACAEALTK